MSEADAKNEGATQGVRFDSEGGNHYHDVESRDKNRPDHMKRLMSKRQSQRLVIDNLMKDDDEEKSVGMATSDVDVATLELSEEETKAMDNLADSVKYIQQISVKYKELKVVFPVGVRIENLSYSANMSSKSNEIRTVYNSSATHKVTSFFLGLCKEKQKEEIHTKVILDNVSFALKPGKMSLVLGPPGSGKSSLLKAIAGRLSTRGGEEVSGKITYNGQEFQDKSRFHIDNVVAFIDQLDRHAPRLTVAETFEFAFQCKCRGTHVDSSKEINATDDIKALVAEADKERVLLNAALKSLGLEHVKDTFVGDSIIRGVSGGQRRRVTVGEMMMFSSPIICADEISNGLDASSTFELVQLFMFLAKTLQRTYMISLLQPSPETLSLFDEIILLAEGQLLYSGPVSEVESYFAELGYKAPEQMDLADFLQLLSTPEAKDLFEPPESSSQKTPYTPQEFSEIFRKSCRGKTIDDQLKEPIGLQGSVGEGEVDKLDHERFKNRYANSFVRSVVLNLKRNLTIWIRDRRVLIANAVKNIIMGISVGGVFFQTTDVISILGVLFQGMLFIMLCAMTTAPGFCDERIIYYKMADANFFSAYPFVVGKSVARLPQTIMDCLSFGTILYFMVGLAPSAENYFIFLAAIVTFSVLMNELLFFFATFSVTKAAVQVYSAMVVLFFILFSGFIIAPPVVPDYYVWIYWYNPMAWAYRSIIVNEYRSSFYSPEDGDAILESVGFVYGSDSEPFGRAWVGYGFFFMLGHIFLTIVGSAIILQSVRISGEGASSEEVEDADGQTTEEEKPEIKIPFTPLTMTFEDISYEVKASTGNETLRLLDNVSGAFESGRMCALMGTSGAGKTTLMDVIAMRKSSGTIQGEVRINGFLQEADTFRRCSGFVEQFDVQTPQLTIRETVLFSARLRLDAEKVTDEEKERFCDEVLRTLELTTLADALIGSAEEGGLSFEQTKRVSIAVELAASPSILFLDEPTTGLDARNALLVCKLLRKIADQGRTICATIHQPSSAVFELFDDLLLLKKGGRTVFFGELGEQSEYLIKYLEGQGANPIDVGDNPANWMLREIQSPKNEKDFTQEYMSSPLYSELKKLILTVKTDPAKDLEINYSSKFAATSAQRQKLVNNRLMTIYWRSPTYNQSRLFVCGVIALILGSIFFVDRNDAELTESGMRARFSVTFLSFIIIGILAITSVLPVMLSMRDVFYRHRSAGMLDNWSLGWALGMAEKWFIVLSCFLFSLIFLAAMGLLGGIQARRGLTFWGIFTFNMAIYSYFGQAFMCSVRSMTTAQILASVFIGLNNFFSGLIVRPQFLTGFFDFTYYITPGHYVYEGLVVSQFSGDERTVMASNESDFFVYLGCDAADASSCNGTVSDYVEVFFGGRFSRDNLLQDFVVLGLFLVAARLMTFVALWKLDFSDN